MASVERGGNWNTENGERRGGLGKRVPFPFSPFSSSLSLPGLFAPALQAIDVRAIQLHCIQQGCCRRIYWISPSVPSQRHREYCRSVFTADNDASIIADVEYNRKKELSLII